MTGDSVYQQYQFMDASPRLSGVRTMCGRLGRGWSQNNFNNKRGGNTRFSFSSPCFFSSRRMLRPATSMRPCLSRSLFPLSPHSALRPTDIRFWIPHSSARRNFPSQSYRKTLDNRIHKAGCTIRLPVHICDTYIHASCHCSCVCRLLVGLSLRAFSLYFAMESD